MNGSAALKKRNSADICHMIWTKRFNKFPVEIILTLIISNFKKHLMSDILPEAFWQKAVNNFHLKSGWRIYVENIPVIWPKIEISKIHQNNFIHSLDYINVLLVVQYKVITVHGHCVQPNQISLVW